MLSRNYNESEIVFLYNKKNNIGKISDLVELYQNIMIPDTAKLIYGHYAYGIHKNNKRPYTYMSFVREPFLRTVSMYFHYVRLDPEWQSKILYNYNNPNVEDFFDFKSIESFFSNKGIHNQQCMFLTGVSTDEINRDQSFYAKLAIENIKRDFSFVGLNERFEESAARLSKILKLSTTKYQYRNKGVNKPTTIEESEKLKEIVLDLSKADKIIYQYIVNNFR